MLKEPLAELQESRDAKKQGVHNVAIGRFHDVRATMASIEQSVSRLNPSVFIYISLTLL